MEHLKRIIIMGVLFALIAVGSYYLGYSTASSNARRTVAVTSTTTITQQQGFESPVTVEARKDNFIFQVYLEKAVYRIDEPVTVRFNLTYLGDSALQVGSYNIGDQFSLRIWNKTQSIKTSMTMIPAVQTYTISRGQPMLGGAVITKSSIGYYGGPGGNFVGFSSGSTYYLEGSVSLFIGKYDQGLHMTAPPLSIVIID